MRKCCSFALAAVACVVLLIVPTAPAAAASLLHAFGHPSAVHLPMLLSILAVPAPRALTGVGVRADGDPKALIGQLQAAFEEFKKKNDERLAQAEARGEDAVTKSEVKALTDTIAELQAAYDDQQKKIAASVLQPGARKIDDPEYSKAWNSFIRSGDVAPSIQASIDKSGSAAGGYLAPTEWDRTITDKLVKISPMRDICRVVQVGVGSFSKLFNNRGMASGWVGDEDVRPATGTPTFGSVNYASGELYANAPVSQQILDDAQIDLESFVAGDIATEFARAEGAAFVSGNGTNKPNGILTYVTGGANAGVHPFGAIAVRVATGTAGSLTNPDDLQHLVYDLPSQLTQGARFGLNRNTLAAIMVLKDSYGHYLWQPSIQQGEPALLLGYPVTELPDMPDIATGAFPVLFGDFADAYLIVDRFGVRMLRDPYTNKPYVQFYVTKRVGGGLLNPEEMKALKIN